MMTRTLAQTTPIERLAMWVCTWAVLALPAMAWTAQPSADDPERLRNLVGEEATT